MQVTFTDEVKGGKKQGAYLANAAEAINAAIAERVGPQKYRVWFKNSTMIKVTGDYVEVKVPNHFISNWLESHFYDDIRHAVRTAAGNNKKVTFNIDPELSVNQKRSSLDSQAKQVQIAQDVTLRKRRKSLSRPGQSPLKLHFDSFVVGKCNRLAYNASKAIVAEERSPFNPLFFHGGYGVGKTHLLQGICNEVSKNQPGAKWLYVSAEDFANQFVLALKTQKLEAFRRRFRQTDVLAIDDIHFLASKPSMQEEFLHTFNTIDLAGKQVVLASDAPPKMIGKLCEKLVNRFVSGMVIKIESPDFETRCMICSQRAKAMGQSVPRTVIEYIAGKMRTNVRELEGALLKLTAYATLVKHRITLAMAHEVLADHISRMDPIVHISDIESAVTTFFGVTTADVHSSRKDRTVSLARSFSMHLARKYTKMSYPEIGRLMGGKNHATVILANRRITEFVERNAEVKWQSPAGCRVGRARDILDKLTESIS